jgi:hypothetical protein
VQIGISACTRPIIQLMADAKPLQHPDAAPVPPSSPTQDQIHQAQPSIEASSNPTTKRIFAPSPKQDSPLAPKTRFSQPTVQAADTIDVFSDSYPLRQSRYTIPQGMSKTGRNSYRQSTDKDKGIPEFDTITEDYDNPQVIFHLPKFIGLVFIVKEGKYRIMQLWDPLPMVLRYRSKNYA